jgi:hypothetical protein
MTSLEPAKALVGWPAQAINKLNCATIRVDASAWW